MVAAGLRQIAAGGDTQLCRERLQEHRHQAAHHDDAQQRVPEFRAALDIGRPVAGVHVTDSDEIAGAGKRQDFAEPGSAGAERHRAMRLWQ